MRPTNLERGPPPIVHHHRRLEASSRSHRHRAGQGCGLLSGSRRCRAADRPRPAPSVLEARSSRRMARHEDQAAHDGAVEERAARHASISRPVPARRNGTPIWPGRSPLPAAASVGRLPGRPPGGAAIAQEVDVEVRLVGWPMGVEIVEEGVPVADEAVAREVGFREGERMVDPGDRRGRLGQTIDKPTGKSATGPVALGFDRGRISWAGPPASAT